MGSLRLTLRFRDVVSGIDTIDEHRKIIGQHGKVLWGWWKKEWEPHFDAAFSSFIDGNLERVTLIDREKKKAYSASCSEIRKVVDTSLLHLIPQYYRAQAEKVSGWFFVHEIEPVEYNGAVAHIIGESTYLIADGVPKVERDVSRSISSDKGRDIILHISDLHFGKDYAFLPPGHTRKIGEEKYTFSDCLVEDLNRQGCKDRVGLIIATGDFTTQGDWEPKTKRLILDELRSLLQKLNLSKDRLVAVPGNHDIVRYGKDVPIDVDDIVVSQQADMAHELDYRVFQQELTGRLLNEPLNYWVNQKLGGIDVDIAVLNSCTITATEWTEYGYVSSSGLNVLNEVSEIGSRSGSSLKIVALHHHLVPVSRVEAPQGKGVSLTLNSVELLDTAIKCGFQMALHGHQHLARISTYGHIPLMGEDGEGPITIVSGGSSGAKHERRPGEERNTYSLLILDDKKVSLKMRELRPDKRAGAVLYDGVLPIKLCK